MRNIAISLLLILTIGIVSFAQEDATVIRNAGSISLVAPQVVVSGMLTVQGSVEMPTLPNNGGQDYVCFNNFFGTGILSYARSCGIGQEALQAQIDALAQRLDALTSGTLITTQAVATKKEKE